MTVTDFGRWEGGQLVEPSAAFDELRTGIEAAAPDPAADLLTSPDMPALIHLARELLARADAVVAGVNAEDALEAVAPIAEALTAAGEP